MHTLHTKSGPDNQINWETFADSAKHLMPKTIKDKMYLFLRAIAPVDIPESKFYEYEFS